jgi:hypothetical protein
LGWACASQSDGTLSGQEERFCRETDGRRGDLARLPGCGRQRGPRRMKKLQKMCWDRRRGKGSQRDGAAHHPYLGGNPLRGFAGLGTNFAHESHKWHEWGGGKGGFIRVIRAIGGQLILPRRCPGQRSPFPLVGRAFAPLVRVALPLFPKA